MAQRLKYFLVVLMLMFAKENFSQDLIYTDNAEILSQRFISFNKVFKIKSFEQKKLDSVYYEMISDIQNGIGFNWGWCWGKEFQIIAKRNTNSYLHGNLAKKPISNTSINFYSSYTNNLQKEAIADCSDDKGFYTIGYIFNTIPLLTNLTIPSYIPTSVICNTEYKFEKQTSIPLRLRLGSLDYTNYLEQKPNAIKPPF